MNALAKKQDYFTHLRSKYHSLNSAERNQAIYELAQTKTNDSIRELIHIYNECGWRETKFQILKNIIANPNERCLEFLFDVIMKATKLKYEQLDLPLAESAINALGQTKSQKSAHFLRQMYFKSPESIKPSIIQALGQLADRQFIDQLIAELPRAIKENQSLLIKSIVVTLGELKANKAIPQLIQIARGRMNRDVALSAVVSIGKISRNLNDLAQFEEIYKSDSFEYQIYSNAKQQLQFRAAWKIEDYLNKIMTDQKLHPSLYLEFNSFKTDDVKAALDMLTEPDLQHHLFKILSKLDHQEIKQWYEEYLKIMDNEQKKNALISISEHSLSQFETMVTKYFNILDERYTSARLFSASKIEYTINEILENPEFKNGSSDFQIRIINEIYLYLMSVQMNEQLIYKSCRAIEVFFLKNVNELNENVQLRFIRLFSQLKFVSKQLNQFCIEHINKESITTTIFNYFENDYSALTKCEQFKAIEISKHIKSFLKLTLNNQINIFSHPQYSEWTDEALNNSQNDVRILVLKHLTLHTPTNLKNYLQSLIKSNDEILQLHLVIAFKAYGSETDADTLERFLNSNSASISGRALDALLSLPGNRAKRIITEYAMKNYSNPGVIEKICRSFQLPDSGTEYFAQQFGIILRELEKESAGNVETELLKEFHQQLLINAKLNNQTLNPITEKEIFIIDQEIESKIPSYRHFDETSKAALRSAEINFKLPQAFSESVDKSSIVLGYSKAIDIILEKQLGRKIIFPKLEIKLNEFQNVIHSLTLNEDYPNPERLITLLQLEKHFSPQSLPVHKMRLVAQGILNGKIINEHFKILDGLRAWAVMLLLFARKNKVMNQPLIIAIDDEQHCISLAKKLMWLQDIRNPIAHRQTVLQHKDIEAIRNEVFTMLKTMNYLLFS